MTAANFELMEALQVIEREKGVSVDTLLEALANALVTAYKRMPNAAEEALVTQYRVGGSDCRAADAQHRGQRPEPADLSLGVALV